MRLDCAPGIVDFGIHILASGAPSTQMNARIRLDKPRVYVHTIILVNIFNEAGRVLCEILLRASEPLSSGSKCRSIPSTTYPSDGKHRSRSHGADQLAFLKAMGDHRTSHRLSESFRTGRRDLRSIVPPHLLRFIIPSFLCPFRHTMYDRSSPTDWQDPPSAAFVNPGHILFGAALSKTTCIQRFGGG